MVDKSAVDRTSEADKREDRRSLVRITVTYGAAAFLFLGGAVLIGWFMVVEDYAKAKNLFLAILPVASALVSYWFAGRSKQSAESASGHADKDGQQ